MKWVVFGGSLSVDLSGCAVCEVICCYGWGSDVFSRRVGFMPL